MQKPITGSEIMGIFLLLLGGFFMSFKFYKGRFFSNWKKIMIAGVLAGVSLVILKISYDGQNFISGYIYSRSGIVVGTLILFAWPAFRKTVLKEFSSGKKKNVGDLASVVGVKTLAGLGTVIVQYTVFLGSITIINALVSVQYLFTFIISTILSIHFKKIFQEELFTSNIFFKFIGVILVMSGVFLVNL